MPLTAPHEFALDFKGKNGDRANASALSLVAFRRAYQTGLLLEAGYQQGSLELAYAETCRNLVRFVHANCGRGNFTTTILDYAGAKGTPTRNDGSLPVRVYENARLAYDENTRLWTIATNDNTQDAVVHLPRSGFQLPTNDGLFDEHGLPFATTQNQNREEIVAALESRGIPNPSREASYFWRCYNQEALVAVARWFIGAMDGSSGVNANLDPDDTDGRAGALVARRLAAERPAAPDAPLLPEQAIESARTALARLEAAPVAGPIQ